MITTLTYDYSGLTGARHIVDAANCVATVAYWNKDGKRELAYAPSDGPPTLNTLVARLRRMLTDRDEKWCKYWQLLARHPWSVERWREAGVRAARWYGLPADSTEEVIQAGQVTLCTVLNAEADLGAWLRDPLEHFEPWFLTLLFNLCNAAARKIGRFSRFEAPLEFESNFNEVVQEIADYRQNGSPAVLNEMLAIFERYPERIRAVVLLRWQGNTWTELAASLGLTVEAARWAVAAYLDDLRRDFASFR